jgi:hypothetical protein
MERCRKRGVAESGGENVFIAMVIHSGFWALIYSALSPCYYN